jgi:hypothetical protein
MPQICQAIVQVFSRHRRVSNLIGNL